MSKSNKHTPGPWTYDGQHIMSSESGRAIHSVIDDIGMSECDMRLCAAAPEMLECCELFLKMFAGVERPNTEGADWLAKVRAAITKATGGTE